MTLWRRLDLRGLPSSQRPRARNAVMTESCVQPAWQQTRTLPSLASRIERLGSRSSWAGQCAIQLLPDLRPLRALAKVSADMAHLATLAGTGAFPSVQVS